MIVELKGIKALDDALGEFSRATAKNVGRRALREGGEIIRAEWERLAPEDEGDLKRAIKVGKAIKAYHKPNNTGDFVTEFVGIDEGIDRRLHIYAEVIEFGNESHPAQPAGRPAWEAKKHPAMDAIVIALGKELDKAAARAARKAARLLK